MTLERTYTFKKKDYLKNDDNIISDYIKDCELDFRNQSLIFYANHLFANNLTMLLLKNSIDEEEEVDYGVELITGDIEYDFETYCKPGTIVAINTYYSYDEPLLRKRNCLCQKVFFIYFIRID